MSEKLPYLVIDTSDREKLRIGLNKQTFLYVSQKTADDLLVKIKEILTKQEIQLTDLKTIFVKSGPGSYTGLRIGVTAANTLGWSLDIPVIGFQNDSQILEQDNLSDHFTRVVLPIYE